MPITGISFSLNEMLYFAYGSNMWSVRLKARIPGARFQGVAGLSGHDLRWHKVSLDGSGKCDAWPTGEGRDRVEGVLYEIPEVEMTVLDGIEGVGFGYERLASDVVQSDGSVLRACFYQATRINEELLPYHWYKALVLRGAEEHELSPSLRAAIQSIQSIPDPDSSRTDRHEFMLQHGSARPETSPTRHFS